jgi:hypothetical protein
MSNLYSVRIRFGHGSGEEVGMIKSDSKEEAENKLTNLYPYVHSIWIEEIVFNENGYCFLGDFQ